MKLRVRLPLLFSACFILWLAACAEVGIRWTDEGGSKAGYSANPVDFSGISFNSGAPIDDEPLADVLSDPNAIQLLRQDLEVFRNIPRNVRLRVVGHTDSHECSGSKCIDLSLRRARALQRWYIEHGVDPDRLDEPVGFGDQRPVDDNATAEGRARNRRAYVSHEGG